MCIILFSECLCPGGHSAVPGQCFNVVQFPDTKHSTKRLKKMSKLEMVDPISLNVITVGTVVKILKHNWIMIAVDGKGGQLPEQTEHFCVASNSPYLLPMGFCDQYNTQLKAPPHHRGKFLWPDYLEATGSEGAAPECFTNFQEALEGRTKLVVGNKVVERFLSIMAISLILSEICAKFQVEAIDSMCPSLILPATVIAVAGHLVKLNFDSWESSQDQWKFMYSEDIFPIGFCDLVKYKLTPPKKFLNEKTAKEFGITIEEEVIEDDPVEDMAENEVTKTPPCRPLKSVDINVLEHTGASASKKPRLDSNENQSIVI